MGAIMRNKFVLTAALVLAVAGSARAQDPPSIPEPTSTVDMARVAMDGKWYGTVDFGGRITEVDGDQARYQRYRDLRSGVYATNMLAGRRTADWNLEAQAWNIGYRDQKYQLDMQRVGRLTASFLYDQIPLWISGDTRTLYTQTNPGVFRLEDTMQQQIQAGTKTIRDFEDQAALFELRTMRRIGQADVVFNANRSTDIVLQVKNTAREGNIPFGGTFGFSNAVELPAPIDTNTADVKTALEWGNQRGMLRVGWDGSTFDNNVDAMIWDNPLRFGPDIAGTPSQGRMSLWPDNTLTYLHGTGAISLPARSRLTAYVAIGEGRSDASLLPFTINSAIQPIPLERPTAEAESQIVNTQFTFASRPLPMLAFNAKYRYSDVDIQTPIFERAGGAVGYDSSYQASVSPSEYHNVTRSSFDAEGALQLFPTTALKVGYGHLASDYTHRIWESTAEDVFKVSVDTTGNQYVMLRGLYENRTREGDNFNAHALEEVGELPGMRHFDVADRNRKRFTLLGSLMTNSMFGFNASAGIGRDEYPDSPHGLQSYDSDQYSIGVTVAPEARFDLTASYGWENYASLQRSRNASSTADQANPARDWTTDYAGKVNYFEAGLNIDAIERTAIRLSADWNKSNDTYVYGIVPGGPLAVPEQLPPVTNELMRAELDVNYELSRNLHFGVAYWFEDYQVQDFALGPTVMSGIALPPVEEGQAPVATNALLLGYQYRPYTAHTGFVRLTYTW
jgi:MtrB/PioB family decaheme-associated outer membrane protein